MILNSANIRGVNFIRYMTSVGTCWTTRGRNSSPRVVNNFHFYMTSKPALGPTQLHIGWVTVALSLGVKRPGREADHLPPTSTEVKETWVYTSTHPCAFMA
jgi:hypothetical protein